MQLPGTAAKVKFYNEAWVDLSGEDGKVTTALATQPTAAQAPENVGAKSIIGAEVLQQMGFLVLEPTTEAMILPTVSDVQNILSPLPGMMVYGNKAGAKRLAVFNGN